jgi:transposase-like protein
LRYGLSYRDGEELLAERGIAVDEADHGRFTSRLRPMRGLKRLRSVGVISAGHAFVQNLRRGHDELGVDVDPRRRLLAAFAELALAI